MFYGSSWMGRKKFIHILQGLCTNFKSEIKMWVFQVIKVCDYFVVDTFGIFFMCQINSYKMITVFSDDKKVANSNSK